MLILRIETAKPGKTFVSILTGDVVLLVINASLITDVVYVVNMGMELIIAGKRDLEVIDTTGIMIKRTGMTMIIIETGGTITITKEWQQKSNSILFFR